MRSRHDRIQSDRRVRRATRVGIIAATVGALIGGSALASLPATAATSSAPSISAIAGNATLTVAWKAVPYATGYTVSYSTSKSMSHASSRTTTSLYSIITKLKNGTTYYARVAAKVAGVSTSASTSKIVSATAHMGVPLNVGKVTVKSAGPNQITVSWTGGGKATKVGAIAGSDSITENNHMVSGWYPATTRSITMTVPSGWRSKIGAGSGNPIFVKVVQSNLTTANNKTVMHLYFSDKDKYRLSPAGTWALAGANPVAALPVSKVSVGELNVQSVDSSASFSKKNQWAARVGRVAKTIEATHPDLVTTAELATARTGLYNPSCVNSNYRHTYCSSDAQYMDLARELSKGTVKYALATTDSYEQVYDIMQQHPAWNGHVTDGAQIFYNPDKLVLIDHGYISPVFTLGVTNWSTTLGDRWLSWAKFAVKNADGSTGRQFISVAAHFPVGDSKSLIAIRAEEASKAITYINNLAKGLPIVFSGDLNADAVRTSNPAATKFIAAGYVDAAATVHRSGTLYSTSNGTNGTDGADPGYPTKAVPHPYITSRIDYIMVKNSPYLYKYENVVHLTGKNFSPSFQGTDHNLQYAIIGIGDPVPTS